MNLFNTCNKSSLINCTILCFLLVSEVLELLTFSTESSKEAIGNNVPQWEVRYMCFSITLRKSSWDVLTLRNISWLLTSCLCSSSASWQLNVIYSTLCNARYVALQVPQSPHLVPSDSECKSSFFNILSTLLMQICASYFSCSF